MTLLVSFDRDPTSDITALQAVSWVMNEGAVVPIYPEWACGPIRDGLRPGTGRV